MHVDASVLALHLAGDRRFTPLTRAVLGMLAEDELRASTSALSIYQLLVEAYRRGEAETAATAERYLTTIPGLDVVDVTPAIARQASQVRAQLGGSTERAVQIATALSEGATVYPHAALRLPAGGGDERRVARARSRELDAPPDLPERPEEETRRDLRLEVRRLGGRRTPAAVTSQRSARLTGGEQERRASRDANGARASAALRWYSSWPASDASSASRPSSPLIT